MDYAEHWKIKNRESKLIAVIGKADEDYYKNHIEYEVNLVLPYLHGNEVVVDYGAGMCDIARLVSERAGCTVIAVDVCEDIGQDYSPRKITDGRSMPFADNSIDMVYSFLTLQHMTRADVKTICQEFLRCLKVGGQYLLQFSQFGKVDYEKGHETVAWTHAEILNLLHGSRCNISDTGDDKYRYWLASGMKI